MSDEETLVQSVLDYWFSGDQDANYKTKWFPEGSSTIQAATDAFIYERFRGLLDEALVGAYRAWETRVRSALALIVLLDQFSRHIFRFEGRPLEDAQRRAADEQALRVALAVQRQPEVLTSLSTAEFIFSLMPLRHSPTVERLQFVLERLQQKEALVEKSQELMIRFRKQTVRRLQHLEDRAKLELTDDVLEHFPFAADESDVMSHPLVSATASFLHRHLLQPATGRNVLLLSLSGGVDSMVLSKILCLLRDRGVISTHAVVAMHIDYANRPESAREAEYVRQWCDQCGIVFRVRVISEVTRGVTDRDEYERVARDLRYAFYAQCRQEAQAMGTATDEVDVSGVIFGHHLGDVQENVISNVMRGSSCLSLSGMTETSVTNQIPVWRPLLSHDKQTIFAFAHRYGVPYFKDSTPSWSTRGKLRNQLVPLLIDIYGTGCLANLSSLAVDSDEHRSLLQQNLYQPFLSSVRRFPAGVMVSVLPYQQQPVCFWKEALRQLMHGLQMSLVRDKAVSNFVERLQRGNTKKDKALVQDGWLELRKGYHTYLSPGGDLCVVRDGILRRTLVVYNPATTKNQQKQAELKKAASAQRQIVVSHEDHVKEHGSSEEADEHTSLWCVRITFSQPASATSMTVSNHQQYLQFLHRDYGTPVDRTSSPEVICFGPWQVRCEVSITEILAGKFDYDVWIPVLKIGEEDYAGHLTLFSSLAPVYRELFLNEQRSLGGRKGDIDVAAATSGLVSLDFSVMELRLREGLPLLIPPPANRSDNAVYAIIRLYYQLETK